jgi:hypothetical protein
MKLQHYPETDSLHIELKARPGGETREVVPGRMPTSPRTGRSSGSTSRDERVGTLEAIHVPITGPSIVSAGVCDPHGPLVSFASLREPILQARRPSISRTMSDSH